jgi:hypothetical protein
MFTVGVTSVLFGGILGLRFRWPIIIPMLILELLVIAVAGLTFGHGLLPIALAMVFANICLQLGYLFSVWIATALGLSDRGVAACSPEFAIRNLQSKI